MKIIIAKKFFAYPTFWWDVYMRFKKKLFLKGKKWYSPEFFNLTLLGPGQCQTTENVRNHS